jgi:sugar lactone lactonase YvrE
MKQIQSHPKVSPRFLIYSLLFCSLLLASCSTGSNPAISTPTPTSRATLSPPAALSPTPTSIITPRPAPTRYTSRTLLHSIARPDDLGFDQQGQLLFSDFYNGTVSRLNADGSVTVLLRNIAGPEGLVVMPDGTMFIAEQQTNRMLVLPPHVTTPTVLRNLPGTPSAAPCKDGVDGIALDPTNNTLIIPDSPTGEVYRLSLDGKTLTLLAKGIIRPVGAAVDPQGNIYIADECGGAVVRIDTHGNTTRLGDFGMPDDVALDTHGNLYVTDLKPDIHALIRLNLASGKRETLATQGLIEPQGLVIDARDNIFVSDDYANIIMELSPA